MLEKVKNGPAKRILSLVLVLAMIFPMMHIQASAEDGNAGESTTEEFQEESLHRQKRRMRCICRSPSRMPDVMVSFLINSCSE